ncbi:hypothetical protein [Rhizobium sp. 'Codium 1']|nr:hypothetical protein [Rhizobium sp. 'Codium 1']MCC8934883.1 hypothetical protein [Rhizobium sp. 'Codium 1']
MKTFIRFASIMEALPLMDPVDPRLDHTAATKRYAFAGSGSPAAFAQA